MWVPPESFWRFVTMDACVCVVENKRTNETGYVAALQTKYDCGEMYGLALAKDILRRHKHIEKVELKIEERPWERYQCSDGSEHSHLFVKAKDPMKLTAHLNVYRDDSKTTIVSGVKEICIMKTTQSGFAGFSELAPHTLMLLLWRPERVCVCLCLPLTDWVCIGVASVDVCGGVCAQSWTSTRRWSPWVDQAPRAPIVSCARSWRPTGPGRTLISLEVRTGLSWMKSDCCTHAPTACGAVGVWLFRTDENGVGTKPSNLKALNKQVLTTLLESWGGPAKEGVYSRSVQETAFNTGQEIVDKFPIEKVGSQDARL